MFYHFRCLCPWAQFHNRFYINFRQGFLSLSLGFSIRIRDHFLCLNAVAGSENRLCSNTQHTPTHKEFSKLCNWQTELEWNSIIRANVSTYCTNGRNKRRAALFFSPSPSLSTHLQHLTIWIGSLNTICFQEILYMDVGVMFQKFLAKIYGAKNLVVMLDN